MLHLLVGNTSVNPAEGWKVLPASLKSIYVKKSFSSSFLQVLSYDIFPPGFMVLQTEAWHTLEDLLKSKLVKKT